MGCVSDRIISEPTYVLFTFLYQIEQNSENYWRIPAYCLSGDLCPGIRENKEEPYVRRELTQFPVGAGF